MEMIKKIIFLFMFVCIFTCSYFCLETLKFFESIQYVFLPLNEFYKKLTPKYKTLSQTYIRKKTSPGP